MSVTVGPPREMATWRARVVKPAVEKVGRDFHARMHQKMSNELTRATPVGNPSLWQRPAPPGYTGGRAKGSWLNSVHAPDLSPVDRIDPGGAAVEREAEAVADQIPFAARSFIASTLIYMKSLNEGHSTQAPSDFIGAAFARVGSQFR